MTRLKLREGCTVRQLPDGDAVVSAGQGETAVILNQTGHAIVELLDEARSEQEIVTLLSEQFPDHAEAIRRDVAALMAELIQAGVVESCGDVSSTA